MCGIAGLVDYDRPLDGVSSLVASFDASLAHRGPDGAGAWTTPGGVAPGVLLVHRRLAIIDPTQRGAQPMTTPDGRHHMVFNGEIYNHVALRAELASRGERFQTESDTEVLLRLVALDGPAALTRVRGMFAFACWDASDRSLLVARDRFGIKPLYVATRDTHVAFASELSALAAAGLVDNTPSTAGVLAFLEWGSVPPPLTWKRGVEMLPPGTWRRWSGGGRATTSGVFADVRNAYPGPSDLDVDTFRAHVADGLRDSVRAHLVADVPVGVFLSGGIDSGALVSCAMSAGATTLQTFTVGFDDESSEAARATLVARTFGTEHQELRVSGRDVADDLPTVLGRLDQPTIDAVNSYYVSRAVAATGVKAVLSGAGADELFGGYPSFTRVPRAMALKHAAGALWPAVGALAGVVMPERLRARWRHFASTNGSMAETYRVQRGFLLPDEVRAIAGPALRDGRWREACETLQETEHALLDPISRNEMPAAAVARLETRMYLGSQLLRDLDVMSMAHGLEVRVPFVDHELVSRVWPQLGAHPALMRGKRLLHEALERPLPEAIVNHPKQGFTLPFARWMRGELAPLVRDGLQRLADGGWVTTDAPDRLWSDWRRGVTHWSRPWGLSVLGHFLEQSTHNHVPATALR
ncbi:MAG TPA: asparagine synthase (glutamine-hydrolyzing) [Vicinamibacterales bacterium]|nr:asparagine synthase (glutamine-hydrolyzing) [Vicinamibacterales bacterium]